jgi:hypothetical protein
MEKDIKFESPIETRHKCTKHNDYYMYLYLPQNKSPTKFMYRTCTVATRIWKYFSNYGFRSHLASSNGTWPTCICRSCQSLNSVQRPDETWCRQSQNLKNIMTYTVQCTHVVWTISMYISVYMHMYIYSNKAVLKKMTSIALKSSKDWNGPVSLNIWSWKEQPFSMCFCAQKTCVNVRIYI